jgi:predicted acyltransferase
MLVRRRQHRQFSQGAVNRRTGRLVSLDAFRGLTIAGMILVDNPGNWTSVFSPLAHAEWNGCSLADLVFPWFLFILGVAMPFAFAKRQQLTDAAAVHRRILRRTVALIALGLILNAVAAWPALSTLRIPGVLQRIGLVYGAAALIFLHTPTRYRRVLTVGLLLGHWAVLEIPTWGGGFDLSPTNNVAAAIDRTVFGGHLLTAAGDPEGLLGLLSATATALIGTLVGDWLHQDRRGKAGPLALAGLLLTTAGFGWSGLLPMNKALWTGSYALFTSGGAMLVLAGFHRVLDHGVEPAWTRPLLWLGVNPLAIYFASELVRQLLDRPLGAAAGRPTGASWLFWSVLRPTVPGRLDDQWVALVYGALVVIAWTLAAGQLHRSQMRFQV